MFSHSAFLFLTILLILGGGLFALEGELGYPFELQAQSEDLELYFDRETGEVAVRNKATDVVYRSNPFGTDTGVFSIYYGVPGKEQSDMNDYLHSVKLGQYEIVPVENGIRVVYTLGNRYRDIPSYLPQLISKKRFDELILSRIEDEEDRQFVLDFYELVMAEERPVVRSDETAPTAASPPRWQFWKSGKQREINIKSAEVFEQQMMGSYRLVSLDPPDRELQQELDNLELSLDRAEKSNDSSAAETARKEIEAKKPKFLSERSKLLWKVLEKFIGRAVSLGGAATRGSFRADIATPEDLVPEDFAPLYDTPTYLLTAIASFDIDDVWAIVEKTGYSLEDLRTDHLMYRLDPPIPDIEVFSVTVEYRIEGSNLVVRIPANEISFPMNVPSSYRVNFDATGDDDLLLLDESGTKESRPLYTITLLRYFGAADTEAAGYIFVPDGSGSLIDLNTDKTGFPVYNEPVYGKDRSIPVEKVLQYDKYTTHLPVFGIKNRDEALFAVVESGEAITNIRADVARSFSPYNVVYPSFTILARTITTSLHTKVTVVQKAPYRGDIQVRYYFLDGAEADYSGMASTYREYLLAKHDLRRIDDRGSIPFYLDIVGAVTDVRNAVFFPVEVSVPLTTFQDATDLVAELEKGGVSNPVVRYLGWLKGGFDHFFPKDARHDSALGRKSQLEELNAFVVDVGGELYPDVSLTSVYRNRAGDGFSESGDAARFISRLPAKIPKYDVITLEPIGDIDYYVLSPSRIGDTVEGFSQSYRSKFDIPGLSLGDLGLTIDSDFRENEERFVHRQESFDMISQSIDDLTDDFDGRLLFSEANIYAAVRARHVVNMPDSDSSIGITDRSVPFYQMVLHGYVNYCGEPINFAVDPKRSMLRALETGSYPHVTWFYSDPAVVKGTEYNFLYDAHYLSWIDRALEYYQTAQSALGGLHGIPISSHREIGPGVFSTEYENGVNITVNYNDTAVEIEGVSIDALDLSVSGGGR